MNLLRRIQSSEEAQNSPDFQKLLAMQEHPTFSEICRFLKHEIARILPRIYPDLYNTPIAGGFVRMFQLDSSTDCVLVPDLFNPVADIYVQRILHKLDVDTPCHTAGDIVNGKLNVVPAGSITQYGKSHKNQILEWLAAKQYDNMFIDEERFSSIKRDAGQGHDGGES